MRGCNSGGSCVNGACSGKRGALFLITPTARWPWVWFASRRRVGGAVRTKVQVETYVVTEERHARARQELDKLARRIRSLRESRGLTQEEFASRCGISVSFASLLERGERSPSYETLVEVSGALEISMAELFSEAPAETYDDPYYARLLELARRARISRAQVDRLVAVGEAMFAVAPSNARMAQRRPESSTCAEASCGRPVLAKGLCASHYHRARRARL